MFKNRSLKLERIDSGDYTAEEYERFLREIAFINRYLGDKHILKKTLFREIENHKSREFSVLDVGAGSGEILRAVAEFASKTNRKSSLCGVDLNEISAETTHKNCRNYNDISVIRANAFYLPFADNSFDYSVCTLFTHHFRDAEIVQILSEMRRVSRRKVFVADLHRHFLAFVFYKIFCVFFRISPLVRHDGSLSILRSFKPKELRKLGANAGLEEFQVERFFPFRIVLSGI